MLFLPGVNFFAGESKSLGRFEIADGAIQWPSGKSDRGLLLGNGQEAKLLSGVESYCIIKFARVDGHVGINVVASDTLPNLPHHSADRFIRARQEQHAGL